METLENQESEQKNLSSLLEDSDSGISPHEQSSILSQIIKCSMADRPWKTFRS